MLFFTLSNLISAIERQGQSFDAVMAEASCIINWHHSFLYLPESTTQREQSTDYSSNQFLSRKNDELQLKPRSGRYKTKVSCT